MRRRDTLRRGALLGATGGLGLLAGCTGGSEETDEESTASLSKTFDYREGDSGNLVVTVSVQNSGSSEGSGRLYVTVTAAETTTSSNGNDSEDGDDGDGTVATRKSMKVTVPASETKTVTLSFDIGYDQFLRKGSLNVDFRT